MTGLTTAAALLRRPPSAWVDAARAVGLAVVVEIGLRTAPVTRLARVLGVRLILDGSPSHSGELADVTLSPRERQQLDVTWRVLRHRPFNGTCLRRALLGARVLRRRPHAVRIGVHKVAGTVRAHAWLELDGIALDPDGVADFRVLAPVAGASS